MRRSERTKLSSSCLAFSIHKIYRKIHRKYEPRLTILVILYPCSHFKTKKTGRMSNSQSRNEWIKPRLLSRVLKNFLFHFTVKITSALVNEYLRNNKNASLLVYLTACIEKLSKMTTITEAVVVNCKKLVQDLNVFESWKMFPISRKPLFRFTKEGMGHDWPFSTWARAAMSCTNGEQQATPPTYWTMKRIATECRLRLCAFTGSLNTREFLVCLTPYTFNVKH